MNSQPIINKPGQVYIDAVNEKIQYSGFGFSKPIRDHEECIEVFSWVIDYMQSVVKELKATTPNHPSYLTKDPQQKLLDFNSYRKGQSNEGQIQ